MSVTISSNEFYGFEQWARASNKTYLFCAQYSVSRGNKGALHYSGPRRSRRNPSAEYSDSAAGDNSRAVEVGAGGAATPEVPRDARVLFRWARWTLFLRASSSHRLPGRVLASYLGVALALRSIAARAADAYSCSWGCAVLAPRHT